MPERAPVAAAVVELHSELVLVCPELRSRLRGLLPERASDAFDVKPAVAAKPAIASVAKPALLPPARARADRRGRFDLGRPAAVLAYAGLRLLHTAFVLIAIGAILMLLWLAEVFIRL